MKKLNFVTLICTALIVISCGKKASLDTSIPKDAVVVTRFDIKSLALKSDYNIFENQTVKAGVEMFKTNLQNDSQKKIFEKLQKNPNSFGINIIDNAYLFMNEQVVGFILPVNNAKKIYDSLIAFEPSVEHQIKKDRGIYSILLAGNGIKLTWDKSKLLILINYNAFVLGENFADLEQYFNLPEEKSIVSDKNYSKFASSKSDITIYYAFVNYVNLIKKIGENTPVYQSEIMQKVLEIYKKFNGVTALFKWDFEKGKIVVKSETLYASKEDEQRSAELSYHSKMKISGELLKFVPQNPLMLFAINLDGEKILATLDKLGFASLLDSAQTKIDVSINLKSLISSLKGDFILSLNNVNVANSDISASFSIFAQLANSEVVKSAILELVKKSDKIKQISDGIYATEHSEYGVKNNLFYCVSDNYAKQLFAKSQENPLAKKIAGQPVFFYGDLSNLKEILHPLYDAQNVQFQVFAPLIDKGLSLVQTYETKYIDENTGEFIINFADKKQNSLKQLFGWIDEVISKAPLMR